MMRYILLILLALSPLTAHAADAVTIIPHSTIDRDQVLVGDLFTVSGDTAQQPVGTAPAPGKNSVYNASALRRIAMAYNIAWTAPRLDTKAIITRASTEITTQQITDAVRDGLAERLQSVVENSDSVDIQLDRRNLTLNLPSTAKNPALQLVDIDYNPATYRFKASLMIEYDSHAEQPQLIPLTGRALPMLNVPVLIEAVQKDALIKDSDVEFVAIPVNKVSGDILTQSSAIVGKEARRDLQAGTALRNSDFRPQQLVKRGGLVTMVVETGGLRITARGRALGDAGAGDTVRILNLQSNRTVEGKVLPDGNVVIAMGA